MALRPLGLQLVVTALILGTVAAVLPPVSSVEAQAVCSQLALTGTGGSNSLLGQFFELGLRCSPGYPLQLVVGGRWSEQHPTANAFGLLSYTIPLSQGWSASVVGSYRERLGDYEEHRLPEALLRYTEAGNGWIPSLELSSGSIQIVQPSVVATRLGGVLGLKSPVGRLAPGLEAVAAARVGAYSYDSGATQSFYGGAWRSQNAWATTRRLC
jgi:hypothetical protein